MASVTLKVLSEMTTLSAGTLRVYLSHYTLNKYRVVVKNEKGHRCQGYTLSYGFLNAFENYLTVLKGKRYAKRILQLMEEYKGNIQ